MGRIPGTFLLMKIWRILIAACMNAPGRSLGVRSKRSSGVSFLLAAKSGPQPEVREYARCGRSDRSCAPRTAGAQFLATMPPTQGRTYYASVKNVCCSYRFRHAHRGAGPGFATAQRVAASRLIRRNGYGGDQF